MSPAGSIAFFGLVYAAQLYFEVAKNNKLTGLSTAVLSLLAWDPSRVNKADYVLALSSSILAHQFYVRYIAHKPLMVRIRPRRRSHEDRTGRAQEARREVHREVYREPVREPAREAHAHREESPRYSSRVSRRSEQRQVPAYYGNYPNMPTTADRDPDYEPRRQRREHGI